MKSIFFYDTTAGRIGIADNGKAITDLLYVGCEMPGKVGASMLKQAGKATCRANAAEGLPGKASPAVCSDDASALRGWAESLYNAELHETALIRQAAKQLNEYLAGKRKTFDLPLEPGGTPFQKAVWHALTGIPYGETRTYREIAEIIGNPKACRAVGMANNKNPIAIIIPCHRVIGTGGKLIGYAGGLDIKKKLLELEKSALHKA